MINKDKILKEAQKFVQKAQWDKAIAEYSKIVADTPNDAITHNAIGDLYLKKNDTDHAIDSYKKAADIFNKSGFTLKAIALYKKVLNIKPDQVDILLVMGKLNAERGMFGNANESYLAAASYYAKQGQNNRILDIYKTLCELNPDNHQIAVKLAELYMSEGLYPEGVSKYIDLADKAVARGELKEARDYLGKAAQHGSDRFDYLIVSAMLDLKEDRLPEATRTLEEAHKTDPSNTRVATLLAETYLRSGRYEDSGELYRKLLALEPSNMAHRKQVIDICIKTADYDSAWKEYQVLADGHLGKAELDSAEALMKEFIEHKPDSIEARQALADIYAKAGRDADIDRIHMQMAEIYRASGLMDKAANIYRQLVGKAPDDLELAATLAALEDTLPNQGPEADLDGLVPSPIIYDLDMPSDEAAGTEDLSTPEEEQDEIGDDGVFDLSEEEPPGGPLDEPLPPMDTEAGELDELDIFVTGEEPDEGGLDDSQVIKILSAQQPQPVIDIPEGPFETNSAPSGPPAEEAVAETFFSEQEPEAQDNLAERLIEIDVLIKSGMLPMAREALTLLESKNPLSVEVKERYVEIAKAAGDVEGFVDASIVLAELYDRLGMPAESIRILEKASAMDPSDERLKGLLGIQEEAVEEPTAETQAETPVMEGSSLEEPAVEAPGPPAGFTADFPAEAAGEGPLVEEPLAEDTEADLDELSEADFYANQGLLDEAREIYNSLLAREPGNEEVRAKLSALDGLSETAPSIEEAVKPAAQESPVLMAADLQDSAIDADIDAAFREFELGGEEESPEVSGGAVETAAPEYAAAASGPASETPEDVSTAEEDAEAEAEEFFDLGAELLEELGAESGLGPRDPNAGKSFEDSRMDEVFQEFKKGVEEQLGKEDYETHYNLGIAYKEMGMLDDAISEFILAGKDPYKGFYCQCMLGLCYLDKGEHEKAVEYMKEGLKSPGHEKSEYMGLKYDLATAYERMGDIRPAQALISELHKEDPEFRDVKARLEVLNKELDGAGLRPEGETGDKEPPKPVPHKKSRVSYL